MTYWRTKLGVLVLMFGLILLWNQCPSRAMAFRADSTSGMEAKPSLQYYKAGDYSLGEFLPSNTAGSLLNGLFSRDWSPNVQLRIFGVSLVAPFNFFNPSQECYFFIRQILLLPFEAYDIGYPFHSFW